ncbi:MAG: hypothetical protein LBG80_19180 [Bacteroidales bacterium]|jgi:hypothetical protein|nr:hypothetical protein [Bacteroidales bacterium]
MKMLITEEELIKCLKDVDRKLYSINRNTDVYAAIVYELETQYNFLDCKELLEYYFGDVVYERPAVKCFDYLFGFESDRILEERKELVDFLIKSLEKRIEECERALIKRRKV